MNLLTVSLTSEPECPCASSWLPVAFLTFVSASEFPFEGELSVKIYNFLNFSFLMDEKLQFCVDFCHTTMQISHNYMFFSCQVMSNCSRPHGLQHDRLQCNYACTYIYIYIHTHTYVCLSALSPLSFPLIPSLWVITECQARLPVLFSNFLLSEKYTKLA